MATKKQYIPQIISPRKSSEEFLMHLNNKIKCTPSDVPDRNSFFMKAMTFNVLNCILNVEGITEDELEFEYYLVEHNEETEHYYEEMLSGQVPIKYEPIYVLFEKKKGYITSNSQMLLLELFIEQGIDEEELKSNSILAKSYLSRIDRYKEDCLS